jgi:PBSX family phage terminase large subunit
MTMSNKFIWGEFSDKSMTSILRSTKRLNIWSGSVRSGKTITSLVRWIEYIVTAPRGRLLMVGKTERTLKRNILGDLEAMVGSRNYKRCGDGEIKIFGRVIDIVGANDERAENKIRGATYAGAYCDEITLYPESFFRMLLSRLSVKGAKLLGTTNPDSPYHWFKEHFLDNQDLDISIFNFTLDDNLNLDEDYKENIKKEYTGLWYKRFILGLWVMAAGIVYEQFNEEKHKLDDLPKFFDKYYICIDYGTNNPCVFLLIGKLENRYYVVKEYYHEGRKEGQVTDSYYAKKLKEFTQGYKINQYFLDPSASSFKTELLQNNIAVTDAENSVIDGIRTVSSLLENDRLFVNSSCKNLLKEFSAYIWDEKAGRKGEDKPVKAWDHCQDALRYCLYSLLKNPVGDISRTTGTDRVKDYSKKLR